jgi:hypothetical protein
VVSITPGSFPDGTVCLITSPEPLRAFLAVLYFCTEGGTVFTQGVIMPGLGPDGDSVYERVRNHQAEHDTLTFKYGLITEKLGRLNDPNYTWLANEIWHELTASDTDTAVVEQ